MNALSNRLGLFDLFDDVFNTPFGFVDGSDAALMRTDVKKTDTNYELVMDVPGYTKDDIAISLEQGYLKVTASKNEENEDKDEDGNYIFRERSYGTFTRSFYVGKNMSEDDINATLDNGLLKITLPVAEPKKIEEKKTIAIH